MAPVEIQSHAIENLRYIRQTIERASSFTAVPGRGGVAMGITACIAAWLGSTRSSAAEWLAIWIIEAFVAIAIGVVAIHQKAKAAGLPLWSNAARQFAFAFAPPIVVGAILTAAIAGAGMTHLLPGTWLMLYGVAVAGAGAFSIPVVRRLGLGFLAAGALAMFLPSYLRDVSLGAGFGGLHILFGMIITRKHGG